MGHFFWFSKKSREASPSPHRWLLTCDRGKRSYVSDSESDNPELEKGGIIESEKSEEEKPRKEIYQKKEKNIIDEKKTSKVFVYLNRN